MRYNWIVGLFILSMLFFVACEETETVIFTDGDGSQETDGDESADGDVSDGDQTDGDVTDGDVTDGDVTDGDEEPQPCTHLCDCDQGWICNADGFCEAIPEDVVGTVFCCTNPDCPEGAPCEFRSGEYGRCPGQVDGDVDGDSDEPACETWRDCPACHDCVEVDGQMACSQMMFECISNEDCPEGTYCAAAMPYQPQCGGTCEVKETGAYDLHEWGVNVVTMSGDASVHAEPDHYYGAMPAKPVVYLYADEGMEIDVGVRFSSGGSTETWPELPNSDNLQWENLFVRPGECELTPTPQVNWDEINPESLEIYELPGWIIEDASCITHNDTTSKLLFYTGNFEDYQPPVDAMYSLADSGTTVTFDLANTSYRTLGKTILLYRNVQGDCYSPMPCSSLEADLAFGVIDQLAPGESKQEVLELRHIQSEDGNLYPEIPDGWNELSSILRDMLEAKGLTEDEQNVFMNAWQDTFFGVHGEDISWSLPDFRQGAFIIHMWPDSYTASMLPMNTDPMPREEARAIVQYQQIPRQTAALGTISGTVTLVEYEFDPTQPMYEGPARNATVRAWQGNTIIAEYTTGDDGFYRLNVAPGTYTVTAERGEWESGDRVEGVVVRSNETTTVDLTITSEAMVDKPNLYLYPQATTNVDVLLNLNYGCEVTESIPEYGDGWHVTVAPSGLIDGQYTYLFYEAEIPRWYPMLEGWTVAKGELAEFFEQTLTAYGFTASETADFVDYWPAYLTDSDSYDIFPLTESAWIDPLVGLNIHPQPDSLYRLWLVIRPADDSRELLLPTINPIERVGFAAVEWGVILD